MQMDFRTVFDAAEGGYGGGFFVLIGLGLMAASGALAAYPWLAGSYHWKRSYYVYSFAFATIWTVVAFGATYHQYVEQRRALASGHFSVVEGIVTDFSPTSRGGTFVVAGRKFSYSRYGTTGGYTTENSKGEPPKNGTHIRVTHIGDTILRLEIARGTAGDKFFSAPGVKWLPKR
jgi:hypothetical protein